MPRGIKAGTPTTPKFALPERLALDVVKGEDFTQIKTASRLSGIHPEILAAGRKLLAAPTQGVIFKLGDAEMVKKASDIETVFLKGLRKVSKAFGGGKAKSFLDWDQKRIVFWLDAD